MLAAMHLTPIGDFADVEPVLEQMGERAHAEADTVALAAIAMAIDLGPDALPIKLRDQSPHGAKVQIPAEDGDGHRHARSGHRLGRCLEAPSDAEERLASVTTH